VLAGDDSPAYFTDDTLQRLMSLAIVSNSITYLHPSFGYYFERLHATPLGPVLALRPLTSEDGIEPPLGPEVVEAATKWWQTAIPGLGPLATHQQRENPNLQLAGAHYAMLLNTWGASLLQLGITNDALRAFATAEALNPENIAATINRQYAQNLIAGSHEPLNPDQRVNNLFGKKYRSWDTVLGICGPVEEPGFLLTLARTLWKNGLNRQAAERFQRLTASQPGQPMVWLGLAESLFNASLFPRALDVLAETHRRFPQLDPALRAEAVRIEAWSRFHGGDPKTAEELLLAELSRTASPSPVVLEALGQVYLLTGRTQIAAQTMDRQLEKQPDHPRALLNRAALAIQMGDPRGAIAPLDHLLTLAPSNAPALFNRATAHLQLTNLDAAERDYRLLTVVAPRQASAVFGLGEVCWQRGQFAEAAEHFTRYVGMTPTNAAGRALATERIAEAAARATAK
jgi:tetratricopeptide (TPR) repeat protein